MTATARQPVTSAAAWTAADLAASSEWTVHLSEAEREEIVIAACAAVARGQTIHTVDRDTFSLPIIETRLADWARELATGRGFLLIRGFPVGQLTELETEVAYVGLGRHLGVTVGQNKTGDILTHIRDERLAEIGPEVRLYRTNLRQDFHTDGADLVVLLCLHRAASGGESRLASSGAVYNEVLRRRPDLLDVLYRPFFWDRHGEERQGELPYFELAPCFDLDGVPRFFYIGWYIRDAQRHADVPRLTPQQEEAMALIESIANDPAFHVAMDFRAGDIQLLNNARILHAREAYQDPQALEERRHLLRLWLAAHRFASVEGGLRDGINTAR